jgi:hypothetical protein
MNLTLQSDVNEGKRDVNKGNDKAAWNCKGGVGDIFFPCRCCQYYSNCAKVIAWDGGEKERQREPKSLHSWVENEEILLFRHFKLFQPHSPTR